MRRRIKAKSRGSLVYQLEVFYPGQSTPHATIRLISAPEVLVRISTLLAEHHGCEHIVVMSDRARLFAVDCKGNRLP